MRRSMLGTVLLPLAVAACSSSLGSEALDLPPEGVTAPIACSEADDPRPASPCPGISTIQPDTAKTTVEALLPIATAAYGVGARWSGTLQGADIRRTGRPSGSSVSGWAVAFCDGASALLLDVTDGLCGARNLCDCQAAGTCPGVGCVAENDKPFPPVDSAQAISVAFSADPVEVTYDLAFDVRANQWTITRRTDGTVKKVDGSSGAVVP